MKSIIFLFIVLAQLLPYTSAIATTYHDNSPASRYYFNFTSLTWSVREIAPRVATPVERFDLLPWKLIVNPSSNGTCPSVGLKLSLFAVINVVAAISVFILSSSTVAKLTCDFLGGKDDTESWKFIRDGSIGVVVTLIANAINAALLHRSGTPESVGRLMMLFLFRPRVTIANVTAGSVFGEGYHFGAKSAAVQELVMATFSMAAAAMTLAYGVPRGYFSFTLDVPVAGRFMYIGAALYIGLYPLILILVFGSIFMQKEPESGSDFSWIKPVLGVIMLVLFMGGALLSQWMFWGGFVKLAGDIYCPGTDALVGTTFVWIIGSVVSTFVGAAG